MLIIQVALGIVLGCFILAFLPQLLLLAACLAGIAWCLFAVFVVYISVFDGAHIAWGGVAIGYGMIFIPAALYTYFVEKKPLITL